MAVLIDHKSESYDAIQPHRCELVNHPGIEKKTISNGIRNCHDHVAAQLAVVES